jgi:hypothetical protein
MKKIVLLLICFVLCSALYAQQNLHGYDKQPIHFGFSIGYNSTDLKVIKNPYFAQRDSVLEINPQSGPGFNLGIVTNIRLTSWADLRLGTPVISFTDRSLDYVFIDKAKNTKRQIESTYVQFPASIKIRSIRHRNVAFYMIAGATYSIDVISQKKISKGEDEFDPTTRKVKLQSADITYDAGFGWDFYYPYFKFSPELKFSFGIEDLLKKETHIYSRPIDKLFSRVVVFTLYFE